MARIYIPVLSSCKNGMPVCLRRLFRLTDPIFDLLLHSHPCREVFLTFFSNSFIFSLKHVSFYLFTATRVIQELMECYKKQGKLHRRFAFQILLDINQYFSSQPTLVDIDVPTGKCIMHIPAAHVSGTIHGDFY